VPLTPIETPVALFVFNRPELTAQAMARLSTIRPQRLLLVADGPRHSDDRQLCERTLEAVYSSLSWDVQLETLISAENLGCRRRLETGLDWVFQQTDRAIVLEDDIEATPTFFAFAEQALAGFAEEPSLRMITGRNILVESPQRSAPFLTRQGSIWAWATWADRWQAYRAQFPNTDQDVLLSELTRHSNHPLFLRLQQHLLRSRLWNRIDTWDIPWTVWIAATGGYCLTPPMNLSANHGIGVDATHTRGVNDLRAAYPLRDWQWQIPSSIAAPPLDLDPEYDLMFTLLEMLLLYEHPRRWKLLARQREALPKPQDEGWQLMLGPFDHVPETRALIAHLRSLMSHPQLDALAAIFDEL
jgi:hypothetical protein